jgi:hypothetical protein
VFSCVQMLLPSAHTKTFRPYCPIFYQRKGMGLLAYQIMPSLCDIADDGVLCTISTRSAPDRDKWCGPSRQAAIDRPSRTKSHPAGSLSLSQPCWASPLAFGRIGFYTLSHLFTTVQLVLLRGRILRRLNCTHVDLRLQYTTGVSPERRHRPTIEYLQAMLSLRDVAHDGVQVRNVTHTIQPFSSEQIRNQQRHIKCIIYASGT